MRSKWLDWPLTPKIIEQEVGFEPSKPTKPGSVGFVGALPGAFPITGKHGSGYKLPLSDPYAERMRVALREVNPPDYPAGMIPWLGTARPDLYAELTSSLPDEIQRLWSERAPLEQFEVVLARLVSFHRQCCDLYRAALTESSSGNRR
jgi:hypothetical protein